VKVDKVSMPDEENVCWKSPSSQLINFWPFLFVFLFSGIFIAGGFLIPWLALGALIPLSYGFWIWLSTRCRIYELTNERMRIYEGVLNQEINEVELYRVKDTKIHKPIWLRLFGLSTVVLETSDRNLPVIELEAVKDGMVTREMIRKHVEILRDKKRVREVDFESGDEDGEFDLM